MERIRLMGSVGALALAIVLFLPGVPSADTEANSGQVLLISDEINGNSVDVDRPSDGNGNNGHGNNADGVDSSNPGAGDGGPNGALDASCDAAGCTDDEAGGGGAAPSGGGKSK